jgi:hypothetical protein
MILIADVVDRDVDPVAGDDRRSDHIADKLGVDRARDRHHVAGGVDRDLDPGAGGKHRGDHVADIGPREEIAGELLDDPRQLIERTLLLLDGEIIARLAVDKLVAAVLRSISIVAPAMPPLIFVIEPTPPAPPATE